MYSEPSRAQHSIHNSMQPESEHGGSLYLMSACLAYCGG